jgi:phospholipid/cholesterol/gamma-HCH transport system ATP-binding protein
MTMETGAAIELKGLKKTFGDNAVLKCVNLIVAPGENVVVLGKSGTGKSVIIKCIVNLITPDEGEILVLGQNIGSLGARELREARKKIGFLFQSGALYDSMSLRENLEFPLRDSATRLSRGDIDSIVEGALKSVGLERSIDKMPSEISGGMRKRLGLARTLILKPQVMLYDEPTTGLDSITSKEISKLILEVQAERKTSSIIITHDLACAKLTANRIVVLKDGEFVEEGSYDSLQESADPWVRSFFG